MAHAISPWNGLVYLVLTVPDNGKGFTEEERSNPFKGSREADTITYRSVGLVDVSRRLIQLQGGKLSATSRESTDYTFMFSIKTYRSLSPDELSLAAALLI